MLENTTTDVELTEESPSVKNLEIRYKDRSMEIVRDFDIYGVNSGVIIIGYSNGRFDHINLDQVATFSYYLTKE